MTVIAFPSNRVRGPKLHDGLDYPDEAGGLTIFHNYSRGTVVPFVQPISINPAAMLCLMAATFWLGMALAWRG